MNVDRHGGAWAVATLCAIVALGVGLRVYYAVEKENGVQDDSIRYFFIARSLYLDHSFDAPEVSRDEAYHPGSPLFHAGVFFLTGGVNPKASRIAAALLSALMIVFTFLLARRLAWPGGDRDRAPPVEATAAGLIAAFLIAVNPSSIDYYRSLMNEPLASIMLVAAVLAFLWAAERASLWGWALPGALIGLTVMFRPEAILFGAALALIAAIHVARARDRTLWGTGNSGLAAAGALLLAMALALAPWTIRNAITVDKVTPVSEGSGNALFIGTYLPADGDHFKLFDRREQLMDEYGVPPAQRAKLPPGYVLGDVLALVAKQAHPDLPQDKALAKLGREQLSDDITEHPVEYAGVLAQKLWNMWGQGAAAKHHQAGPGAFGDWFHRLAVLLGLAGLVLLAVRRRWEAWVLGSVLVLATAVAVVLLAPPRRNVDLLPLVSALAGYAVVSAYAVLRSIRMSTPVRR
ncbi:MAG: ArnT family glycosyltransferase [Solirubrobacterales bacterium]